MKIKKTFEIELELDAFHYGKENTEEIKNRYFDAEFIEHMIYIGKPSLLLGGAVYKVKEVSNRAGRKSKKKKESE